MLKNKNFLLTVILPIFVSLIIGVIIIILNSQSILQTRAKSEIASEKKNMSDNIAKMKDEKQSLTYTAAEYDTILEENRLLVDEVTALTDELADYNTRIEAAKETVADLDSQISEKTTYKDNLQSLPTSQTGTKKTYTDKTLTVPLDISEGRYTAEGSGTLMIYTGSKLEDKAQNTVSYTFDVKSGQTLKIVGTLTLTKIINNE